MEKQKIDKLLKLKDLYEKGILSKEEMEREKEKVLAPVLPENSSCQQQSESNEQNEVSLPEAETEQNTDSDIGIVNTPNIGTSKETKNNQSNIALYIFMSLIIVGLIILVAVNRHGSTESRDNYQDTIESYLYEAVDTVVIDSLESYEPYDTGDYDHSEQYIESWIEETYGTNSYLSIKFQDALTAQENAQGQGYLCGPDWNYWWWSQDPTGSFELLGVDDITEKSCTAYVVADGNRLYVKLTYYENSWHYDNFIGADDNCNYFNSIIEDL